MDYDFDLEKSEWLRKERGIGFEEVIQYIQNGHLIDIRPHPNPQKYPNQNIYVVGIDRYIYLVPFITDGETIILKTVFPSRKATKQYFSEQVEITV